MKRPTDQPDGKNPVSESDPLAWAEWPCLRSFFFDTTYDDSSTPREPGLVILGVTAGGWSWTLKDVTAMTQLRVQASTWDELILLTEALLSDGRAPWVPDLYARQRRTGKRK